MFSRIINFLKEPYPFYYEKSNLPWILVGFFMLGVFFLYTFQPFNINWEEHRYSFFVICVIHCLVAIIAILPVFLLADRLVQDKSTWQVYKEIGLILSCLILVGIGNFLIRDLIYDNNRNDWTLSYLLLEITNALLIAVILYPIFVLVNSNRLKAKHSKEGLQMSQELTQKSAIIPSEKITISNTTDAPDLVLSEDQFLFVKSEGNYITVYFKNEQQIEKRLIRSTLTTLSDQYPHFFRPHRSYLVNLNQVSRIGGNSQGYTLHFANCEIVIPVSRNKKDALIKIQQKVLNP